MRKLKILPDVKILRELFDYHDGLLIHKTNNTYEYENGGYNNVVINNEKYRSHRIIWKLLKGYDPYILDHKDKNKLHNVIDNLREGTDSLNVFNVNDDRYPNKINFRGLNKWGDKYRARISVNNKRIHLGLFKTKEEAHRAYLDAVKKYYG